MGWPEAMKRRGWYYCGYVTFDSDPFPGADYGDEKFYGVEVHGGMTYKEGASYGFDCAHGGDWEHDSPSADLEYVKAQTEELCNQLLDLVVTT